MDSSEKLEISIKRSYQVVKANELIRRAKEDLSLPELKAFAYIVSMIKPTDVKGQWYDFDIKNYCKIMGINYRSGANYEDIKATFKRLRDTSFYIVDENGHSETVGWLEKVKINPGSGKLSVRFDDTMQKYLVGVYEDYTQYELLCTLPMKSAYSFRLYELLKSYAFTKSHTFEVDELKQRTLSTNYTNFKDFRKKVLEVATREINLYTDLEIEWEPVTFGKKVVEVAFTIKTKDSWSRYESALNAKSQIDGQLSLYDLI